MSSKSTSDQEKLHLSSPGPCEAARGQGTALEKGIVKAEKHSMLSILLEPLASSLLS